MISTVAQQRPLVSFLREVERELGGNFQIQEEKAVLGVGQDGKGTTYLCELLDEQVMEGKLWFSNRLYPLGVNNRLSSHALPEVRFVRFDMERPDHSTASEAEIEEVKSFFEANGARAGIRTPRGFHAYVVLENPITPGNEGYNPIKDFCFWMLRDYKGPLVPDVPSWSRSNVSRMVPYLAFYKEGATVKVPAEVQAGWVEVKAEKKKAVKGQVKFEMAEGAGSLVDRAVVASLLKAWCYGMSETEAATACGCKVEKVQLIWQKYARADMRGIRNAKDEKGAADSLYLGEFGPHRKRRQKTFSRYADRWWAYEDFYETFGNRDQKLLCDLVINCESFKLIKMNIMESYNIDNDVDLATWVIKDVEAQANYTLEKEKSEVSKEVLESVETIVSTLGGKVQIGYLSECLDGICRRQVLRAVKALGYKLEGKGAASYWSKDTAPKAEEVKATQTKDDIDVKIANLIREKQPKIEIFHGPGGSGKTRALKREVLEEDVLLEGSLVPIKRQVEAKIMALSNQIVQELMFEVLKRPVTTIHTGLKIPVNLDEMDAKKVRAKLICIDEFSMVSKKLWWAILERMSKGTRLVLIGDTMQLPPVDTEGKEGDYPLRDLIALAEAGHPNITVRQFTGNNRVNSASGGLAKAIEDVRKGIFPTEGPGFTMDLIPDEVSYIGDRLMNRSANAVKERLIEDPFVRGVSTLKGGVEGDGFGAQNIANKIVGRKELRVNDDIVCNVTDRKRNLTKGSIGKIVSIKTIHGEDLYGCRVRCMDKGKIKDLKRWLTRAEVQRPQCRNAHQLQGTQADSYVITLERSRIMTREMFYMELSRAKENAHLISTPKTVEECLATTVPYTQSEWCTELMKDCKK